MMELAVYKQKNAKVLHVGENISFGKYEGTAMEDIPRGYLRWMEENIDHYIISKDVWLAVDETLEGKYCMEMSKALIWDL